MQKLLDMFRCILCGGPHPYRYCPHKEKEE